MHSLNGPVYWIGNQWAVTAYGLESVGGPYHYYRGKDRLGGLLRDGRMFALPIELLEKSWLDIDDFREAWKQAMIHHALHFHRVPATWELEFDRAVASALVGRAIAGTAMSQRAQATVHAPA